MQPVTLYSLCEGNSDRAERLLSMKTHRILILSSCKRFALFLPCIRRRYYKACVSSGTRVSPKLISCLPRFSQAAARGRTSFSRIDLRQQVIQALQSCILCMLLCRQHRSLSSFINLQSPALPGPQFISTTTGLTTTDRQQYTRLSKPASSRFFILCIGAFIWRTALIGSQRARVRASRDTASEQRLYTRGQEQLQELQDLRTT